MINVDEAIKRGHDLEWSASVSHTEAETAFQDRTVLANEVVAMREVLREAEEEVENLRREMERTNWM